MKNKNILVFCIFALTVTLAAWVVINVTKQHSQSSTGHSLLFGSQKTSTETTNDSTTHDTASHDATTNTEASTAPQASEETKNADTANDEKKEETAATAEFENVEFIQYTVKENDTVWKIATTFMPDYNAHPKDGKEGVIAYIVKENKLEKLADDTYRISTGQKLTIPKQKDLAASTTTKSSSTVKTATTAKNTSTAKTTTTKSTTTATKSTSTSTQSTTSATNTATSSQTDHSAHQ